MDLELSQELSRGREPWINKLDWTAVQDSHVLVVEVDRLWEHCECALNTAQQTLAGLAPQPVLEAVGGKFIAMP